MELVYVGYRISDSHYLTIKVESTNLTEERVVPESNLTSFCENLAQEPRSANHDIKHFLAEEILVVCQTKTRGLEPSGSEYTEISKDAKIHILNHKITKKNELIQSLNNAQNSLSAVISSAKEYTHADLCSIWVHNSHTNHQVCIASDKDELVGRYLSPENSNNKIYKFISSESVYECAPVDEHAALSLAPEGMKSMTRFRVDFGNNTIGVFSFASRLDGYYIRPETGAIVGALAVNAYQIEHQPVRESVLGLSSLLREIPNDDISTLGRTVTEKVANVLNFEACSLFLAHSGHLNLVATFDREGSSTPSNQRYSLGETSLTINVFKQCEVNWSYSIKSDSLSENGYSEKCVLPDSNWVGLPIQDDNEKAIGVLRVKNKFSLKNDKITLAPLRDSDFSLLQSVAQALGVKISMHLSRIALIEQVDAQKTNLVEFQDHQRILLHEFRAPAHAFMNTPDDIRELVVNSQATDKEKDTISREIADLLIVAERLNFIIRCHRRAHLFNKIQTRKMYVLQDVIMPVVTTYETYIKKQWGIDIIIDPSFLSSRFILGDSDLLSVVMNILLDNAGKYSKSKRSIRISGELDRKHDMVKVFVQNDGYEILENESEKVFEDEFRGSNVRDLKIDGTGIGLNLAKEILEHLNSKIYIVNRKDPVIIAIELPEERS